MLSASEISILLSCRVWKLIGEKNDGFFKEHFSVHMCGRGHK